MKKKGVSTHSAPVVDWPNQRTGASYARFSSELQRDTSIDDQQRVCREKAAQDDLTIPPHLEFVDRAISGAKSDRDGLSALRQAAERGEFSVLYVYSLSRLGRESVAVYGLLKDLDQVFKVRIVSASEGIDSSRDGWYDLSVLLGLQNERYLKDLSQQVKRGQEGTILAGFSGGDLCFGFHSIPDPGGATVGRGRNAKPRHVYAVDEPSAAWVVQIFRWYAEDKQSVSWIVGELNRLRVPKDARASHANWYRDLVMRILRSEKYIGRWGWRKTTRVRDWRSGRVRQIAVPEHEREKFERLLPELQIVEKELFDKAQLRLEANRRQYTPHRGAQGRLVSSPERCGKRFLLDGILQCKACDGRLTVVDSLKQYYACIRHSRHQCGCATRLPRKRAEAIVYEAVAGRLLRDDTWRSSVFESALAEWTTATKNRPDRVAALMKRRTETADRIRRLLDAIELDASRPEDLSRRIAERRAELREIDSELRAAETDKPLWTETPTLELVETQLSNLLDVVRSGTPAAIEAFQGLIDGPIFVEEVPIPNRKRKALKAEMRVHPVVVAQSLLGRTAVGSRPIVPSEVVALDFRGETIAEEQARKAHTLWNQGLGCGEIADVLGVTASRVTAIFRHAEDVLGIPYPATRRRGRKGPVSERIEPDVIAAWTEGSLICDIAKQLRVCRPTVHKILKRWHESQGLPMPDGRTRRTSLAIKRTKSAVPSTADS